MCVIREVALFTEGEGVDFRENYSEIANFYLQSEERDIIEHLQEQQDQQDQQDQYEQYERPTTPTPYGEEDDVDDLIDMYEDLIDSDMIPLQVQDELRNIILSESLICSVHVSQLFFKK